MQDPKEAAYYQNDLFAVETTGIKTVWAGDNSAVCSLELRREHYNARGSVMGGVLFTLADFTFTLAANVGSDVRTVSLNADISFLCAPKGNMLTAEAKCLKDGRATCTYTVDVTDAEGRLAAHACITGYKLTQPSEKETAKEYKG